MAVRVDEGRPGKGRMTRRTGWRRSVAVAAAVASGLVLAGCQSEGAQSPSPSPSVSSSSASPTPSPSPSPTEGEIPAAARVQSEEGAEAFVRFFFDRVNAAWTGPQPGLVTAHAVPECQFCTTIEKRAAELESEGQRYATPPVTVGELTPRDGAPSGEVFFEMALQQNRVAVVDASGATVREDAEKRGSFNVGVRWVGERWRFVDMENLR